MRNLHLILLIVLMAVGSTAADGKLRVARRPQKKPAQEAPARERPAAGLRAIAVDTAMRRMSLPAVEVSPLPADSLPFFFEEPAERLEAIAADSLSVAPKPIAIAADLEALTIIGEQQIGVEQMTDFVRRRNPDFDPLIAQAFYDIGRRYGIRGDIALCQSIIETGWFRFADGTAVKPEQHNYCGLGVTGRGKTGHSFDTVELGVTAQIQHLYAYATASAIPAGEKLIDPRFKLVKRGIAPTWRDLNRRWAMNDKYSQSIMNLFKQLISFHNSQCDPTQNSKE